MGLSRLCCAAPGFSDQWQRAAGSDTQLLSLRGRAKQEEFALLSLGKTRTLPLLLASSKQLVQVLVNWHLLPVPICLIEQVGKACFQSW